jgi:hypothetical protein
LLSFKLSRFHKSPDFTGSLLFGHQISIFAHFDGGGLGSWGFGLGWGDLGGLLLVIKFHFLHFSMAENLGLGALVLVGEIWAVYFWSSNLDFCTFR